MCKIRTLSGETLRSEFTAFEADVIKTAIENGVQSSDIFSCKRAGASGVTFTMGEILGEKVFTCHVNKDGYIQLSWSNSSNEYRVLKAQYGEELNPSKKESPKAAANESVKPVKVQAENISAADKLAAALAEFMPETSATVNADEVREIVAQELAKVDMYKGVSISINKADAVKIEGTLHPEFNKVLHLVSNDIPVYLHGPAGTGKNVLSEQVAKAMNLPFYYAGCLQQKYELEGFVNAAGEYQETEFYRAFVNGGVFLFDEIDGTAAEVLVAFNAALANRYYNFPGVGRVKAHADFKVIAAGNTVGRGATDSYCGRFQLDSSTLDRFAFVKLDYCEEIELQTAGGDKELVSFVHEVRKQIDSMGLTYTITQRSIRRLVVCAGAMYEIDAMECAVCGSWDSSDMKAIASSLSSGNKYNEAFKKAANNRK